MSKRRVLGMMLASSMLLVACGGEEPQVEIPYEEPVEEEEIDMEQFRISGDRLNDEPVLSTEERQLRFIEQYEKIDRPIIMNTLRYIRDFDERHEESFKGVRLITNSSIIEIQEEMLETYKQHLGEPIDTNTTQVFDIKEVYPYTEEDFKSYYETVVKILQEEVMVRTQIYGVIDNYIGERDFDGFRKSGSVTKIQDMIDVEGGLIEQVRPYIQAMDELVVNLRLENGMEMPKYTKINVDEENMEIEEVDTYVEEKPTTVQEIISIEPTSEIYDSIDKDKEEDSDNNIEKDADESEKQETQTGDESQE